MEIEELSEKNLVEAQVFEKALRNDEYFTHFQHTTAKDQLESLYWNVFLHTTEGEVLGWEQIQTFKESDKVHIARLGFALVPGWRGFGYGATMIEHAMEYCKENGYSKMEATSRLDNIPMVVSFIKAGFHIEGCFVQAVCDKHVVSWAKFI